MNDTAVDKPSGADTPAHPSTRVGVLFLLVAVAAVHAQALRFPFLHDDAWPLRENPVLAEPGRALGLLGRELVRQQVPLSDRPALLATHLLDGFMWGAGAFGYHLGNIVWHALAAVLLYLGLLRLSAAFARPAAGWPLLAAGLFAVHPQNVQVVAALGERGPVVSAVFALVALMSFTGARANTRPGGRLGLRAGAFVAASLVGLSGPYGWLVPVGLVAIDLWPRPVRVRSRDFVGWALAATAALWTIAWRAWVTPPVGLLEPGVIGTTPAGLLPRLAEGLFGFFLGALRLVLPVGLGPEYPPLGALGFAVLLSRILAIAAVLAVIVVVLVRARRWPVETLGLALGLLAFLPTLAFAPTAVARADAHMYLPSLALLPALAAALAGLSMRLFGASARRGGAALAVAWVILLAVPAHLHARTWQREDDLWVAALRSAPGSPRTWAGMATMLLVQHRTAQAIDAAAEVIRFAPGEPHGHQLMGLGWLKHGSPSSASAHFAQALDLAGDAADPELLTNAGHCFTRIGQAERGLALFARARALAPWRERPWLNAAATLMMLGRAAQADALLEQFARAQRLGAREARQLRARLASPL